MPAPMNPGSYASNAPVPTAVKAVPATSRVPQMGTVAAVPKADQSQPKPNQPTEAKQQCPPKAKQPSPEKPKEVNAAPLQPEKPNPKAPESLDCRTDEQKMLLAMQEKIKDLEAQLKAAKTGSAAPANASPGKTLAKATPGKTPAKASPGKTPVQTPATRPALASPAMGSSPSSLPRSAAAAKTLSFEDTEVEGEGSEPSKDDDVIITPDGVKADGLKTSNSIRFRVVASSILHVYPPSRCSVQTR